MYWRRPSGAFLQTVLAVVAEAEQQFIASSPLHPLTDQQLARKNALDVARAAALQMAALTAMQASQRDLQAALPAAAAAAVPNVDAMRLLSAPQQQILGTISIATCSTHLFLAHSLLRRLA
jgi:hypothetical protein